MLQSAREVHIILDSCLSLLDSKLENLQQILNQEKIPCDDLIQGLAFMDQLIKSYEEYLKQLSLDAFKGLTGISVTYTSFERMLAPGHYVPRDSPLLTNLGKSIESWKIDVERLMRENDSRYYSVMEINDAISYLKNAEDILSAGSMTAVYGNISKAYDCLDKLGRLKELPDELRSKVLSVKEGISVYKEQIKSGEVNPEMLRERIKEWISRLEAARLVAVARYPVPTGVQPLPPPPPLPPPSPPTREGLRISCGGRSYTVDLASLAGKALIIGRYDPGGLDKDVGSIPDALKIQEYQEDRREPGDIFYIFTNTQCRWSCAEGDADCTHGHHVLLTPDPVRNTVRISYFPGARFPVFYAYRERETLRYLEEKEELELKPGQTVYLGISGVYDLTRSERVTIAIRIAGKASRDTTIQQ